MAYIESLKSYLDLMNFHFDYTIHCTSFLMFLRYSNCVLSYLLVQDKFVMVSLGSWFTFDFHYKKILFE